MKFRLTCILFQSIIVHISPPPLSCTALVNIIDRIKHRTCGCWFQWPQPSVNMWRDGNIWHKPPVRECNGNSLLGTPLELWSLTNPSPISDCDILEYDQEIECKILFLCICFRLTILTSYNIALSMHKQCLVLVHYMFKIPLFWYTYCWIARGLELLWFPFSFTEQIKWLFYWFPASWEVSLLFCVHLNKWSIELTLPPPNPRVMGSNPTPVSWAHTLMLKECWPIK